MTPCRVLAGVRTTHRTGRRPRAAANLCYPVPFTQDDLPDMPVKFRDGLAHPDYSQADAVPDAWPKVLPEEPCGIQDWANRLDLLLGGMARAQRFVDASHIAVRRAPDTGILSAHLVVNGERGENLLGAKKPRSLSYLRSHVGKRLRLLYPDMSLRVDWGRM